MKPREVLSLKDVLNPRPPPTIETVMPSGPLDLEEVHPQDRLSEYELPTQVRLRPPSREKASTASWSQTIFLVLATIVIVVVYLLTK